MCCSSFQTCPLLLRVFCNTGKHYALNDLETGRKGHDAQVDPAAARMSDLLAFQFAIERGDPGSVMCSYNRANGAYACENKWLLTDVLRGGFGFRGYVMSDWGAAHSTVPAALAGLDQESGWPKPIQEKQARRKTPT